MSQLAHFQTEPSATTLFWQMRCQSYDSLVSSKWIYWPIAKESLCFVCVCVCGSKTISDELERDEDKRGADLINRLATDSSMRFIRARQHTTDVVLGYRSVRNDFIRGDGFMFSVIRSSPIRFAYFFIFYFWFYLIFLAFVFIYSHRSGMVHHPIESGFSSFLCTFRPSFCPIILLLHAR